MNTLWIKVVVHSLICMMILLANYGFNMFFNAEHIPFRDIFLLSGIYMVFYLIFAETFGFIWCKPFAMKIVLIGLYVLLAWNIVPIIDAIIYGILPAWGTVLYDESKPKNLHEYHFRIWRAFIVVNAFSLLYVALLQWYRNVRINTQINNDLRMYRARVIDSDYTFHFLKNIFHSTFGKMLLDDAPKEKHVKMDIIEFIGYLVTVEKLGAKDDWLLSKDKLYCFIRLLRYHYGKQAIQFEYAPDGTVPQELPRGVLLFPLENCLKHAIISPDMPVKLYLKVDNGGIELSCESRIDRLKIKEASGQGLLYLEKMMSNSNFSLQIDRQTTGEMYNLCILLSPLDHGKA